MAGVIGLRGPDISKRDALRGYRVEWKDADRPLIRPHTGLPVLYVEGDQPKVERHVFGFSKEFATFNARMDKLESGKLWSRLYGHSHGVAPVSYILEWADMGDGKRAYRIERADGAAMAVPALVGRYFEDRSKRAFALVTIEPNNFVKTFHDRMIGQLDDVHIDVWLHPENHAKKELEACLRAPPDDALIAYPLSKDVGRAKFDDAAALAATGPAMGWKDVRNRQPKKGLARFVEGDG